MERARRRHGRRKDRLRQPRETRTQPQSSFSVRGPLIAATAVVLLVFALVIFITQREAPEAVTAIMRITTAPVEGATVTIGGNDYGETPCSVSGLPAGDLYVILSKEGYKRAYEEVILPEEGLVEVEVELEPIVGYLTLESTPPGAQVILNGDESIGYTPLKAHPVRIGEHTYELRLDAFESFQGDLTIEDSRRYTKTHELKAMQAQLHIQSRPSGATIWIDGVEQKQTTPARIGLPPETYLVTVYAKGYVQGEQTLVLGPNETRSAEFMLEVGNVPPGMVIVPAGEFIFGDDSAPEERPARKINLPTFYIDKYEVTNTDFKAVFPEHTFETGTENWPVRGVSWRQATEYAKAVGKRLPTEAEWEKAARGPEGRQWPWGNDFDPTRLAYKSEAVQNLPVPVGEHKLGTSPYGCMHMAGNVYEWVYDWYKAYEGNTEIAAEYGQVYRVLRGGSYDSDQYDTRSAARHFDIVDSQRHDYGFRCAMDVQDNEGARSRAPAAGR